jgi:hypothetical protein
VLSNIVETIITLIQNIYFLIVYDKFLYDVHLVHRFRHGFLMNIYGRKLINMISKNEKRPLCFYGNYLPNGKFFYDNLIVLSTYTSSCTKKKNSTLFFFNDDLFL